MASPDTTRTAVLAAAVVVALLAVAGGAVLLLRGGDDDELATAVPTLSTSAAPSATPSPTASAAAEPSPAEAASWEVDAAFLTPEAASAAEEPGWVVDTAEGEPGPLLDPCADGDFPVADAVVASDERSMSSQREAGGSELAQEVFRYGSLEAAEQAFADYLAAVERCPEQPDPQAEGFSVQHEVTLDDEVRGARRLVVRRQPCGPEDACTPHFASYVLVAQAADGLTVAHYAIGEDGDPRDAADALLGVLTEQLVTAVDG